MSSSSTITQNSFPSFNIKSSIGINLTHVEWINTGTDVIARDTGVPLYLCIKTHDHHGTPHYAMLYDVGILLK